MKVARQFIAWDPGETEIRPVGYGVILEPECILAVNFPGPSHILESEYDDACATVRSGTTGAIGSYRPYGTGRMVYGVPGNKLPGYDHLVPPGQSPTTPSGTR
jgi:hypothetical protein